jgi:hypothetical protein
MQVIGAVLPAKVPGLEVCRACLDGTSDPAEQAENPA